MRCLRLFFVIPLFLTSVACEQSPSPESSSPVDVPEAVAEEIAADPYQDYCFAGSARLPLTETNGDDCILTINTSGPLDITNMQSTSFIANLSDFARYKRKGFESFSIIVRTPTGPPKVSRGSYVYVPFDVYNDGPVPDVFAEGTVRIDNKERGTAMKPLADLARNNLPPSEWPPLELVSAQLRITHVENMEEDEDDKKRAAFMRKAGIETGRQYIKGNMSFEIAKFGPGGKNFGPISFSFATVYDWNYMPAVGAE